jgi:hypothetical protein
MSSKKQKTTSKPEADPVALRPKPHKKRRMTDAELAEHPDMKELARMVKSGELDRDRTLKFLKEGGKR